jgi:hypothetical protein
MVRIFNCGARRAYAPLLAAAAWRKTTRHRHLNNTARIIALAADIALLI